MQRQIRQQSLAAQAMAAANADVLASDIAQRTGRCLADAAVQNSESSVEYAKQVVEIGEIDLQESAVRAGQPWVDLGQLWVEIPGQFSTALSVVATLAVRGGLERRTSYGAVAYPWLWWWLETSLDSKHWAPLGSPGSSPYAVIISRTEDGHSTIRLNGPFGDFLRLGLGTREAEDKPWGTGYWLGGTLTLGILRI